MGVSRRDFIASAAAFATLGPQVLRANEDRTLPLVDGLRKSFENGLPSVEEELKRLTSDPKYIASCLGTPTRGGITKLYNDSHWTILHIVWAPLMVLRPHDHNMAAAIGVYGGREDNIIWERNEFGIQPTGADSLGAGDVVSLPHDVVHSVINPIQKLTAAIHVYEGDFFGPGRTSWAGENHEPKEFNQQGLLNHFENSNRRFDL